MNSRLGLSFCDRRSVDGKEGDQDGCKCRCDRVCTHFDFVSFFESDQRLRGRIIRIDQKTKGSKTLRKSSRALDKMKMLKRTKKRLLPTGR